MVKEDLRCFPMHTQEILVLGGAVESTYSFSDVLAHNDGVVQSVKTWGLIKFLCFTRGAQFTIEAEPDDFLGDLLDHGTLSAESQPISKYESRFELLLFLILPMRRAFGFQVLRISRLIPALTGLHLLHSHLNDEVVAPHINLFCIGQVRLQV